MKEMFWNTPDKPADKPGPVATPPVAGVPLTSATYPFPTNGTTPVVPVDGPNSFLDRLKAKTDFDSTPIGQQVKEHMTPLEGLPLTESQKFTAVLKAGAKDGLTGAAIIQALQALLATLDQDKASFDTAIDAKRNAAKEIEAKIAAARAEQDRLTTDLVTAQSGIQTKTAQYEAAYNARKTELQDKISHFSELLKG